MEDDQRRPGEALRVHGARVALAVALAGFTYLLFPSAPAVDFPLLELGSVASDNVIAPFAFTVPRTERELESEQAAMARSVEPVFRFAPAALDSARLIVGRFADSVRRVQRTEADEARRVVALVRAVAPTGLTLSPSEAEWLARGANASAVATSVRRAFERWLAAGVAASGAFDDGSGTITLRRDSAERLVPSDSLMTFTSMLSRSRMYHPDVSSSEADGVYRKALTAFFRPTIVYDRVATEGERQRMRRSVPTSKFEVRLGEKIVGAHEVVGRDEYEKMGALRDALQQSGPARHNVGRATGSILINLLIIAIFGVTLLLYRPRLYESLRILTFLVTTFAVVLIASWMVVHIAPQMRPELIPIALASVLVGVLFDPRIGLIAAMTLAVLIGGQADFRGTNALFLALVGGVAGALSVRVIRRRHQAYYSIVAVAGAYALGATAIGLTLDWTLPAIAASLAWGALNAMVAVSLAMILLPPVEAFTGIDTYFKLLEWSDLNRPLMQRLSIEAPGTYAHTIAMANLTEAACNSVGGNGLLARVGTYYHDIGKLKKPQYFVENQAKGRNPHDKLKPTTSASIIRNHVKDGLELADEFHLPKSIRAFIPEHHGTLPISYFLEKAKERDGAPVNTSEYAYSGPTPQSTETAICMLADGVEASVRVLSDPTAERIREVVERIVRQRIEQGQMRDAPLTLRQIETVKDSFARVLSAMHHARIDYPVSSGGITSETARL